MLDRQLDTAHRIAAEADGNPERFLAAGLSIFGDLATNPGFIAPFFRAYRLIRDLGVQCALGQLAG